MSYLTSSGLVGDNILSLNYFLIGLSVAVVAIITAAVIAGVSRRRSNQGVVASEPIAEEEGGLRWITIGVAVSTIALVVAMGWTAFTMAAINLPAEAPRITVEVTGHQWWWQLRYSSVDGRQSFETANEIHLPAGEPVLFKLRAADVIHSFWIPALAGKTDLIPNQTNTTWLQANKPGTFRGQCGEYCGTQHAKMGLVAVVSSRDEFDRWWDAQLAPAPSSSNEQPLNAFMTKCSACHAVRGTRADGKFGPDLSHLMSRQAIAANMLPNTPAYRSAWIANPQTLKPGCKMPRVDLSGPELQSVREFLASLK